MTENNALKHRLRGLIRGLMAVHEAGSQATNTTKGSEREAFINTVLKSVIAPPYRVGSGDIMDRFENRSGQLDIVIEHGGGISFPLIAHETPRLYLAESVCAVVEIKSNLTTQWDEVSRTAEQLSKIQRASIRKNTTTSRNDPIPLLVVGYKSWKDIDTLQKKLDGCRIAAILGLDPPMFAHSDFFHGDHSGQDEKALYGFLLCLESATSDYFVRKPPFAQYSTLL